MPSTTNWEDSEFLMDLGVALYSAAQAANGLTPNIKEAVEAYLKERGHATTWEAVRYVGILFFSIFAITFSTLRAEVLGFLWPA
ncbi:hypothetical protein ACJ41O_004689 [Fusarium nematophilum]